MNRMLLGLSALLAASPTCAIAQSTHQSNAQPEIVGIWVNPSGSVRVETGECDGKLCGWVVWADGKALADARDAGVSNLVGTKLLQDYRPTDAGRWQGRVYVPDMGGTFFSRMALVDAGQLRISGCILGGLLCKSQVWHKQ